MNEPINVTVDNGRIIGYLSSVDIAKREGLDRTLISTWARRGKLKPAFKIGRNYYFDESINVPRPGDDVRRDRPSYILRRRKRGNETD